MGKTIPNSEHLTTLDFVVFIIASIDVTGSGDSDGGDIFHMIPRCIIIYLCSVCV